VTFANSGVYSLTFSIQFTNSDTQIHDANVWLRKNNAGSSGDIPDTDSKFSVINSHGGVHGNVIGTVNFVIPFVAGDYVELIWATSSTQVSLESIAAGTSPVSPRIPSVVFTATQVMYTQLGPTGPTGASITGPTGPTGPAGSGSSLVIQDEGTTLTSAATSIDFTGAGVTATAVGGAVTVTIPGGGGGSQMPKALLDTWMIGAM
jgi:hypothetical protein